jgi:hypothetical protein
MSRNGNKKPAKFTTHAIMGGTAGACEVVSCALSQISLSFFILVPGMSASGYCQNLHKAFRVWMSTWDEGQRVHRDEYAHHPTRIPLALYKGSGVVPSGIVAKTATGLRVLTLETYRGQLVDEDMGSEAPLSVSVRCPQGLKRRLTRLRAAGVGAGVTQGVTVVTPMEVVKIWTADLMALVG